MSLLLRSSDYIGETVCSYTVELKHLEALKSDCKKFSFFLMKKKCCCQLYYVSCNEFQLWRIFIAKKHPEKPAKPAQSTSLISIHTLRWRFLCSRAPSEKVKNSSTWRDAVWITCPSIFIVTCISLSFLVLHSTLALFLKCSPPNHFNETSGRKTQGRLAWKLKWLNFCSNTMHRPVMHCSDQLNMYEHTFPVEYFAVWFYRPPHDHRDRG